VLHRLNTAKERQQPVIVGVRNGIELRVVASSATQRELHERNAGRRKHVVEFVEDSHLSDAARTHIHKRHEPNLETTQGFWQERDTTGARPLSRQTWCRRFVGALPTASLETLQLRPCADPRPVQFPAAQALAAGKALPKLAKSR